MASPTSTEFEITLSYNAGSLNGLGGRGWQYVLVYDPPGAAVSKSEKGVGYSSREGAKAAAEERCRAIAKALLPIETYTYRPEF